MAELRQATHRFLRAVVVLAVVLGARGLFLALQPAVDDTFGVHAAAVVDTGLVIAGWLALAYLIVRALDCIL